VLMLMGGMERVVGNMHIRWVCLSVCVLGGGWLHTCFRGCVCWWALWLTACRLIDCRCAALG
jgi:hypothetical protein